MKSIPWEDKPKNYNGPVWRYSKNPIIKRDHLKTSNSIFNSAVIPYKDGFAGVFRCVNKARQMRVHAGFSKDGIKWDIDEKPIEFVCEDKEVGNFVYAYDPRVTKIGDIYYVTWCNGYFGPTIGVAWTKDFKKFQSA